MRGARSTRQLAAFIEARPGSDLPRDIAHLRGQARIVSFAAPGGWDADVELRIDTGSRRSRSVDVVLRRPACAEIVVVELIDLVADGGEAMRGLADKVAAVRRDHPRDRVLGLLVVRATASKPVAAPRARQPACRHASRHAPPDWIAALTRPGRIPMPRGDGLVWARVDGTALFAARR